MGTAKSRTARISADELAKRQQSNFEAQKKHIRTTDGRALLVSWLLAGLLTCSYIQLYASDNCIATAVFVFTCILVCEFAKIKHTFKPTKQQNKQTKQTNTHTHTHTHKNCSWYTRLWGFTIFADAPQSPAIPCSVRQYFRLIAVGIRFHISLRLNNLRVTIHVIIII